MRITVCSAYLVLSSARLILLIEQTCKSKNKVFHTPSRAAWSYLSYPQKKHWKDIPESLLLYDHEM